MFYNNYLTNYENNMTIEEEDNNIIENELILKETRKNEQLNMIKEKEKLLLTRSRMLQIAQERNIYKKKIIYTLISIIILIIIVAILFFISRNKKYNSSRKNIKPFFKNDSFLKK